MKYIVAFFSVCLCIVLYSCNSFEVLNVEGISSSARERLHASLDPKGYNQEQVILGIISAINNKDSEALKALFSKNAIANIVDFKTDAVGFLDLFNEGIVSWDYIGSSRHTNYDFGDKVEYSIVKYKVFTKSSSYHLCVALYDEDTINEDNLGVYALGAASSEDDISILDKVFSVETPGLYFNRE